MIGNEVCDAGKNPGCSTCQASDDGYECKGGSSSSKSICTKISNVGTSVEQSKLA